MRASAARALSLAVILAAVVVGLLLRDVAWTARLYAIFLLVPLPVILVIQARLSDRIPEEAGREEVYFSSALSVWILAGLAMLAARFGDISRADLRLTSIPPGTLLGAAGLTILAGVALMVAGRFLRLPETPLLEFLLPRTSAEKIAFAGLSISAGIAEELVYRSFLIAALLAAGAAMPTAAAISILAFAVAHAYQGLLGILRVTLLGAIVTAPYLITGSVYPSMIAHAGLDLIAGLVLGHWLVDAD